MLIYVASMLDALREAYHHLCANSGALFTERTSNPTTIFDYQPEWDWYITHNRQVILVAWHLNDHERRKNGQGSSSSRS